MKPNLPGTTLKKDEGVMSNARSEKGESEKTMLVAFLQHGGPWGYDWLPDTNSLSMSHSIPTMETSGAYEVLALLAFSSLKSLFLLLVLAHQATS